MGILAFCNRFDDDDDDDDAVCNLSTIGTSEKSTITKAEKKTLARRNFGSSLYIEDLARRATFT